MPTLKLTTLSFEECTIGRLQCGDHEWFSLELPWLDNQINVSCIPAGIYQYKLRFSPGKQTYVLELQDVEGRTYIQIHVGNYTRQILGCILVGKGLTHLDDDSIVDVYDSETAMAELLDVAGDSGTIEIVRFGL